MKFIVIPQMYFMDDESITMCDTIRYFERIIPIIKANSGNKSFLSDLEKNLDMLMWIKSSIKSYQLTVEPAGPPSYQNVYMNILDANEAMLFKLTWG